MQIRHKETGKVLDVAEGTKFAQSAYEVVDNKADAKAAKEAEKAADEKAKADAKAAKEADSTK